MCGIVGIASQHGGIAAAQLCLMRDSMIHRGPDDAGVWCSSDAVVGLAHRRLSIIDLSAAARQPMSDSGGNVWITLNGEVYNFEDLRRELQQRGHSFRTTSDTEVLLAAYREWDTECLPRLKGMFAFAIYDAKRRRLFLARDRAGEKPLYYSHRPGTFGFASELKALLLDPSFERKLDPQGLGLYLAFGYVPGEACQLRGVRKLLPGHALTYDLNNDAVHSWPYWRLPDAGSAASASTDEEFVDELERLLQDSVRRQLRADVPVGIMLSGGVDSSLITAMAARVASGPVRTFTVSLPGHGALDEAPHARLVARHFGTQHTELIAEPASVDLLSDLAEQFDEPVADDALLPTFLISRLLRRDARVALGGDGGDELFGGYISHTVLLEQDKIRRFLPPGLGPLLRAIASTFPTGAYGREYLLRLSGGSSAAIGRIGLVFDAPLRKQLLANSEMNGACNGADDYKLAFCASTRTSLQNFTRVDFQTYLTDDVLVKTDRASMLASLEVRSPWLDSDIVEFAFCRVPDRLRATPVERKILPKMLGRRVLPRGFDYPRKQGFTMPLEDWFDGTWGAFVEGVLRESDSRLFRHEAIADLLRGQRRGRANMQRLLALTMFELWRRHYKVEL